VPEGEVVSRLRGCEKLVSNFLANTREGQNHKGENHGDRFTDLKGESDWNRRRISAGLLQFLLIKSKLNPGRGLWVGKVARKKKLKARGRYRFPVPGQARGEATVLEGLGKKGHKSRESPDRRYLAGA